MSELDFEEENIPKKWELVSIKQIALLINGKAFKPSDWSHEGLPIVRIQNLNNFNKVFNYCNFRVDKKFLIDNGQLLFAWSGTPGTSFGCFIWNRGKAVLNQHIFRIEINEQYLNKQYLCYAINHNLDKYISKAHGTAGLAHITKGKFEEESILLPPFNEQHRIVAKIESIFAQIDAIKERLEILVLQTKSTSGSLSILKSSILKQAFKGKLVPQDPNDESAKILLSQIHKKSEITFKNNNLPKGWIQTELSHLATLNPKLEKNSIDPKLEVSFVPMRCVEELSGRINLSNTRKFEDVRKGYTYFQNHDIIFAKITPCMENGKIAIPDGLKNGIGYGSTEFHVIRLIDPKMSRKFYFYYFIQTDFRKKAESKMKGTAGQLRVPTDVLSKELVPIPPLNEQKRIVAKIESIFGNIDTLNLFYFIVLGNLFTNLRYFIILYMPQCYI